MQSLDTSTLPPQPRNLFFRGTKALRMEWSGTEPDQANEEVRPLDMGTRPVKPWFRFWPRSQWLAN